MTALPLIMALDIATKTGWAYGPPGKVVKSGSVNLRSSKDDPISTITNNIGFFLANFVVWDPIEEIVVEAAKPAGEGAGGNAVVIAWGCLSVVEFFAACKKIPVRYVANNTLKKHFIGKAYVEAPPTFKPNLRDRSERNRQYGKLLMIERARLLGYLPIDCNDDNRADACGLHDYASHKFHRSAAPRELKLFGQSVPA
jgi:hypothetical protein